MVFATAQAIKETPWGILWSIHMKLKCDWVQIAFWVGLNWLIAGPVAAAICLVILVSFQAFLQLVSNINEINKP